MSSPPTPPPPRPTWRDRFDLSRDQADPAAIDEGIRTGVAFQGTNSWLLVFAIFIASIGLNVNAPAVIIGAMLISPLMGPIMGVGYGAAVADFRLARRAAWNLAIAAAISLATSTLYFLATPLDEAQSELLARTSPTIWDVLIALFGGLAGIVGATRREKSNVVPGVAIATALMPPLCTAGYGVANGELTYVAGALYLFLINSVFIAVATFFVVRLMRLPEVAYLDATGARRAHQWIAVLVITTTLPSLWLAQRLVSKEVFLARANDFVAAAFPPGGGSFVVARDLAPDDRKIHVTVVGEPVSAERLATLSGMLAAHGLDRASLSVTQNPSERLDVASLQRELTEDLYQATLARLEAQERTIESLEGQLRRSEDTRADLAALVEEIRAQHPEAGEVVVAPTPLADGLVVLLERARALPVVDRERLRAWLGVRTGARRVWVLDVSPAEVPPAPEPTPAADSPPAVPPPTPADAPSAVPAGG